MDRRMLIRIKGFWILRLFKIEGMVIYPFVLFASKEPCLELENHEGIHIQQIRRDGVLKFYLTYLIEYLRLRKAGLNHDQSYRSISYEKEAYLYHHDLQYKVSEHKQTARG